MRLRNQSHFWWRQLPTAVFLTLVLWIVLQFNPIFNQNEVALLLLLPVAWLIATIYFAWFRTDLRVFTPKNVMLFIWFNKLVLIPLELIFIGNKVPFNPKNAPIHTEIIIILVSFGAFVVGWNFRLFKLPKLVWKPLLFPLPWAVVYLNVASISWLVLYGSFSNYWSGALFTHVTSDILAQVSGNVLGVLANIGQRFWALGMTLAWYHWRRRYQCFSKWYWNLPWVGLCAMGILSSNRANMVFGLLTFLSVTMVRWQSRQKIGVLLLFLVLGLFGFFFGYVRVQPTLDTEQVSELLIEYLSLDNEYIWLAHQLYLGTPLQITPLVNADQQTFTLVASVFDPVPVLGKAFREQSGPYVYNLLLPNGFDAQDKVIPMAGELYFNGGWALVIFLHCFFGSVYGWLDAVFKKYVLKNPPLAASFFYLSLLLNAVLLLSLSVLVQFILYNAAPALLMILINWWQMRKASST